VKITFGSVMRLEKFSGDSPAQNFGKVHMHQRTVGKNRSPASKSMRAFYSRARVAALLPHRLVAKL